MNGSLIQRVRHDARRGRPRIGWYVVAPMTGVAAPDATRRLFYRACALGGALAAIGFTWMLARGRLDLLQGHTFGDFYDAQARSLWHGRWNVPPEVMGFEAFIIDGKSFMYFGPWPAVLRMPLAAVTDRFDGRLTQLSLLLAFALLLVATSRLLWRVRALTRGTTPMGRLESWAIGGFVAVVGVGSTVLFLASRPLVYHEAALWAMALTIAAYEAILAFVTRPSGRALAAAGALATLALLSRSSMGIGPIVALGLVLLAHLAVAVAPKVRRAWVTKPVRWLGWPGAAEPRGYLVPLVVVLVVPLALYMYVNYAKFGHPWTVPITDQIATATDPVRQQVFADNSGSLFGAKFAPGNAVAALRPDAIGVDALFPWITFPDRAATFGVTFAVVDPSSSIPASMPFLTVLALVGLVAIFRPRRGDDDAGMARLRPLVLGGLAGAVGVVSISFVNHRYLADYLPFVIVLAVAGVHALLRAADRRPRPRAGVARTVVVVLAGLAVVSVWVNFSLALVYQRQVSPFVSDSERAAFIRFQRALDERIPGPEGSAPSVGPALPAPLPSGTLFVVGDCDGVYWSSGAEWYPVERTPATGQYRLEVVFPSAPAGTRETLLRAGAPGAEDEVGVEYLTGDRVRFWFDSPRLDEPVVREPHEIEPGEPVDLEIVHDAALARLDVTLDGRSVLGAAFPLEPGPVTVVGGNGAGDLDFSGDAELVPPSRDFCRRIAPESA
jgi:hypothetical protein